MYTIPEKNIWKLPDGKIWEGVSADLPVSQADLIAKAGHEYPTEWLKEQGWGKKAPAKKKAEPSQTQKVDQLHSHLIKPDTWVYFVRIANKEFVGLSKLDAGNFLNNAKNMSNYKFDTSDNLFKYQRRIFSKDFL